MEREVKKASKRKQICHCIIAFLVCISIFFPTMTVQAVNQNDVTARLNELINQYNGEKWENYSYGGGNMGKQCYEFAHRIFNDLFSRGVVTVGSYSGTTYYKFSTASDIKTLGTLAPGYTLNSLENLLESAAPGDYIQVKRRTGTQGPHSMIAVEIDKSGNRIRIFDANTDGNNTIKCYWQSFSDFYNKNMGVSVYRYSGYTPGPTAPPGSAQISKSQHWYDLSDTIDIYMSADNATGYFMSMFKDDQKIISQSVDSGHFSMPASNYGIGHYSVYCTASNALGGADSPWIDFDVVGPASYISVSASQKYYDISSNISISVSSVCAKGQVIGIDKEGVGRVVTEECDTTFTKTAASLGVGKYSAYFSVYNGSGTTDTERVEFEIVDMLSDADKVDLGNEFYAYIENQDCGYYLTNLPEDDNNVMATKAEGGENQIWKFTRLSNGSYKIQSMLNGGWLDVEEGQDSDGTNIIAYPQYKGQGNQQFNLYSQCGAIYIKPLSSNERVVDTSLDSDKNVKIWSVVVDWGPQKYNIIKIADTYPISYDANGGENPPEGKLKFKDVASKLSEDTPQRKYQITYHPNGGTVSEKTKEVESAFKEWNTLANGQDTSYQPGDEYKENKELKLYAQWKEIKVGELQIPEREGFVFDGWYDSDTGKKITEDTTVTSDLNVYAQWKEAGASTLPGDVNGDGKVNTKDSVLLRKHILDGTVIDEEAGDVDGTGKINSRDSILLRQYILGMDVELK